MIRFSRFRNHFLNLPFNVYAYLGKEQPFTKFKFIGTLKGRNCKLLHHKQVNELKKNIRDGRKFLDAHYFAVNTTVYAVWDTG